MKVEKVVTTAPLPRSLSGTTAVAERSQHARNCSTDSVVAPQSADNIVESPSSLEPNKVIAAWFAFRIVPPPSTRNAGQAALSSRDDGSVFTLRVVTKPHFIPPG